MSHKRRRSSSRRSDRDQPSVRQRTERDSRDRGRDSDRRGRNRRNSSDRNRRSSGGRRISGEITCFRCRKKGHHIRDCPEQDVRKSRSNPSSGYSPRFQRNTSVRSSRNGAQNVDEEQDIQGRLKSLLIRIGEKSQSSLEKNIDLLTTALVEDAPQHKDFILKTIFQCVKGLPAKTPIYACLIGLLNCSLAKIGEEATIMLREELLKSLNNGYYDEVRILIRFMATLVNVFVISEEDFFAFIFALLESIRKQDQEYADLIVFLALSALPWLDCDMFLDTDHKEKIIKKIAEVIDKVSGYFAKRSFQPNILFTISHIDVLYKDDKDKLSEVLKYDYFVNFWHAIQSKHQEDSKTSQWKVPKSIMTPHKHFKSRFNPNTAHKLELLEVFKPSKLCESVYEFRPDLRIFEASNSIDVIEGIDRYIIGEYISDILLLFESNHKKGIKELMSLPVDMDYNHLVIETTLSHLIALPTSPISPIYYGTVIIGFFKSKPKIMPPLLGQAINKIFLSIHTFDIEIRDRFAKWFSFHLSNFNYKWPWQNWSSFADVSPKDPKQIFISDVLVRITRLAFWDRVKETLPPIFISLMPPKSEPFLKFRKPKPLNGNMTESEPPTDLEFKVPFKYNPDDVLYYPLSLELIKLFRSRVVCGTILTWLNEEAAKKLGGEKDKLQLKKLKLFFYTLLDSGKKSFSHTFALLDKYQEILETTNINDDTQNLIMDAVAEFWQNDSLRIVIIVERLITKSMLSVAAVIKWVFSHSDVHKSYVWSILMLTVNKRLEDIESHIANLKEKKKSLDVAMNDEEDKQIEELKLAMEKTELKKKEMFIAVLEGFRHMMNQKLKEKDYHLVESRFKVFCRVFSKNVAAYKSKVANADFDPRVISVFKVFTQAAKHYNSVPRKNIRRCFL